MNPLSGRGPTVRVRFIRFERLCDRLEPARRISRFGEASHVHASRVVLESTIVLPPDDDRFHLGIARAADHHQVQTVEVAESLISDDDLSQVKRAFDLNGYVGIVYFVATAVSLYLR